ncbi:hypothetical protein G6F54_014315 [Rhizopus delemar]|nr:hypothetical protein G6F54_014315 [Rhizopus delemar]
MVGDLRARHRQPEADRRQAPAPVARGHVEQEQRQSLLNPAVGRQQRGLADLPAQQGKQAQLQARETPRHVGKR